MKKFNWKVTIVLGVIVVLLMAGAGWYSIACNDWRLVAPMDFAAYEFTPRDLPMWGALLLFNLYVIYLGALLIWAIIASRRRLVKTKTTRTLNPRLGLLGVFGFLGFAGFWTYTAFHQVYPFVFFLFFGFFGFFYEGRMSGTFMDERFRENAARAQLTAYKITFRILLVALIVLCQGRLFGSLEYTLIAAVIVLSLTLALGIFLPEYLLYHYDHDDQAGEGEE